MSQPYGNRWAHDARPTAYRPAVEQAPAERAPTQYSMRGLRLPPASSLLSVASSDSHHQTISQRPANSGPAPSTGYAPQNPMTYATGRLPTEYQASQYHGSALVPPLPYGGAALSQLDVSRDARSPPQSSVMPRRPYVTPPPQAGEYGNQTGHSSSAFQDPPRRWQPPEARPSAVERVVPRSSIPNPTASETQGRVSGIPNFLNRGNEALVDGIKFHLKVRQQPKAARACGSGERDRRNVDPPPIVQLHIEAEGVSREETFRYLRHEAYVMNCWIYDRTGIHDASHMPTEHRYQRRLTGSTVGTPFFGKDENGQEGCFFPFSDLSVRTLGKYRLKFNLIMLDTSRPGQKRHFPILAETFSEPFDVYTAKDFPGISESSKLVRALREQGCIISIKKGNDKKKRKKNKNKDEEKTTTPAKDKDRDKDTEKQETQDRSDDDDDDDDADDDDDGDGDCDDDDDDDDGSQGKRKRSLKDNATRTEGDRAMGP